MNIVRVGPLVFDRRKIWDSELGSMFMFMFNTKSTENEPNLEHAEPESPLLVRRKA